MNSILRRWSAVVDADRRRVVIDELREAAAPTFSYYVMTVLSCVIATLGLITNSAAVIIGAMLVAPLMVPILAMALAAVGGRRFGFLRATGTLVSAIILVIPLSTALGLLATTGRLNFLVQLPSEVIARTQPNLFDLGVALAGGLMAAYAWVDPRVSATLPGVAIATALMPPLCTVGVGLAHGRSDVAGGALLLFVTNLVAIFFAAALAFYALGFRPRFLERRDRLLPGEIVLAGLLVIVVSLPLAYLMLQTVAEASEDRRVRESLTQGLQSVDPDGRLVDFEKVRASDRLELKATVRTGMPLTHQQALEVQEVAATRLQRPISLVLLVVPMQRLDTLIPPTFTPTPRPNVTITATFSPTPAPTESPAPSPTVTLPATATASAAPTMTPPPTASPVPTATPTLNPTPTPTPHLVVVGATDRRGAWLRRAPALSAGQIMAWPDGTRLEIAGAPVTADGLVWYPVVDPDGRQGWMAGEYLIPYRRPR